MTARAMVQRNARLPDPVRIARSRRTPELGPRILFFSGGSALRKVARQLKLYTHNSIHLVTPFDSGGSSAELRRAFGMLSVGDMRNRLLSLADETVKGNPGIFALFSHRLPADGAQSDHFTILKQMVSGEHELMVAVPEPLRQIVRTHLRDFVERIPVDFDLRRASIGNLILAGGFLANDRDIEAVSFLFSRLVEVRGLVRPVVEVDVHLAADLESGERIVGQHRITAKGDARIQSPIERLFLVAALDDPEPVQVAAGEGIRKAIRDAELICLPIGSYYTSVLANLLPEGVGRAIVEADCPKVFVPNMGADVEQIGMSLEKSVAGIIDAVRRDAGADTPVRDILNLVLVDTQNGPYELPIDPAPVRARGIDVVDLPMVRSGRWPLIDGDTLAKLLLSLV